MNQKRLAGLERAALEHVVPNRHQRLRDGASLQHRQSGRYRHRLRILCDAILRVAAAGHQRHDLVAKLVPDGASAEGYDFAGDFKARQIAGSGRRRVRTGALRDVGAVDAGGCHLDQNFASSGRGHRASLWQQHLGPARLADADNGHLRGQLFHGLSLRKF